MVNSNSRKLLLCGWLQKNGIQEYCSSLKLQKYLLFYESFSKVSCDESDFSYLRGYRRGPVFSDVWGDYTHNRIEFDAAAKSVYASSPTLVNEDRAKVSHFVVSVLSEMELSDLTHKLNLWKSQESRIMSGERQVSLREDDFNDGDAAIMRMLLRMYPVSLIDDSQVMQIGCYSFVFHKKMVPLLTEHDFDVLAMVSEKEELHNPVFVEKDHEGRLIID